MALKVVGSGLVVNEFEFTLFRVHVVAFSEGRKSRLPTEHTGDAAIEEATPPSANSRSKPG